MAQCIYAILRFFQYLSGESFGHVDGTITKSSLVTVYRFCTAERSITSFYGLWRFFDFHKSARSTCQWHDTIEVVPPEGIGPVARNTVLCSASRADKQKHFRSFTPFVCGYLSTCRHAAMMTLKHTNFSEYTCMKYK